LATHPRVLVIEDDAMIRNSLLEVLEEHGYEPVGAVHGRDALAKLDAPAPLPNLILLDLMMPVMDGWTFRQAQLARPALAAIPVVVLSAYQARLAPDQEMEVAAFLQKPIHLRQLLEVIRSHCPEARAE